jgi:putative salt-induced outer membrane protein
LRQFIPLTALLLSVVPWVLADQISLKNGDRLTGTIVKSDGKTLVVHTDYAGDLSIKLDAVQSLDAKQTLHVALKDGKSVAGPVTASEGKLRVSSENGQLEAPLAQVSSLRNENEETSYEKTVHPGFLQEWKSGLNVGFSLTRGNSETRNLSTGFIATRQTLHDKLNAYANAVYATNDAQGATPTTTANTAGGGLRYDHDVRKRIFSFVAADFFSDALQSLNLRAAEGAGLGYHAIRNPTTTWDFLLGGNYTHESYTTLSRNLGALTIGEDFMHKIGKGTSLNQHLGMFPDLSNRGEFRGTFDLSTVTKFNRWLGWQNSVSDIYVTNPPAGKRQNDVVVTTGLHVSLSGT